MPSEKQVVNKLILDEVKQSGVTVVPNIYSRDEIDQARTMVLAHLDLMKNTRSTLSSRHLAGFHHYPVLEPLHQMITHQPVVKSCLKQLCGDQMRTIGLSDITVNRSQQWHKDLLRGKFEPLLGMDNPCSSCHGLVYKVIVYLQDSTSLQVVPCSHKEDISLSDDKHAIPQNPDLVKNIHTKAGDAVIIDICTTHRGAEENAFSSEETQKHPKILISTVFGTSNSHFTDTMEKGNAIRLKEWMKRNHVNHVL